MPDALIALDGSKIIPAAPGFKALFQRGREEFAYIVVGWYPGATALDTTRAVPRAAGPVVWDADAQCVCVAADVDGTFDGIVADGQRETNQ